MTSILIDKRWRILKREDNIIHMATIYACINDRFPGVTAFFSTLTGRMTDALDERKLYVIAKSSFTSKLFSGTRYTYETKRLSLVNGKRADVINLAEYCGKLEK